MLKTKLLKLLDKHMPGNGIRVWLFRQCGYEIGEQVYPGEDLIVIDDLEGRRTKLRVGDRASISPRVTFVLQSAPNWSRIRPHVTVRFGTVTVGRDAWIGTGAVILPDIEVGDRAIVASNSVVTKNVPAYTVVGGVPARTIKSVEVPWKT